MGESAALVVAILAFAGSLIAGLFTFLSQRKASAINARTSDDSRVLGLIEQAQETQSAALTAANAQLAQQAVQLRAQDERLAQQAVMMREQEGLIRRLRAEVGQIRRDLTVAIRRGEDCERARAEDAKTITQLRGDTA